MPTNLSRGEEARARILDAAIHEFAASGYRGALTRGIAGKANVNLAALTYYFENKAGLYRAALEFVEARATDAIAPVIAEASDALGLAGTDAMALRRALLGFVDRFLDLMLGRAKFDWRPEWTLLMARAEFEPPEGSDWAFGGLAPALMTPCVQLVARITGRPDSDEECRLAAMAILGQVTGYRAIAGGLPGMNWKRITDERRSAIRHVLHRGVLAHLDAGIRAKA